MLQTLLDDSISQHGYWLINNIDTIRNDLNNLLAVHGAIVTSSILNEIDNPITVALYKKIDAARSADIMCPIDPQARLECAECQ